VRSGGHGFCGIGRKHLLNILQDRCLALGVELVFETDVSPTKRRWPSFTRPIW
jgi:anthraniloyl-CoA monooxygenase